MAIYNPQSNEWNRTPLPDGLNRHLTNPLYPSRHRHTHSEVSVEPSSCPPPPPPLRRATPARDATEYNYGAAADDRWRA